MRQQNVLFQNPHLQKENFSSPVQFPKNSCPIVNVSAMNSEEFKLLVSLVVKINFRKCNANTTKKTDEIAMDF